MNFTKTSSAKMTIISTLSIVVAMLLVAIYFVQNPDPIIKISILVALLFIGYTNGKITAEKSRRLSKTYDLENIADMRTLPTRTTPEE